MTRVDWDSPNWGKPGHNVHESSAVGDEHNASEDAAERRFA